MQLKAEVSLTTSALEETRTSLTHEEVARARLDEEASALRLDRERDLRDLRASHSAELTAAREDGVCRAEEAAAARASEVKDRTVVGFWSRRFGGTHGYLMAVILRYLQQVHAIVHYLVLLIATVTRSVVAYGAVVRDRHMTACHSADFLS